MSEKENLEAFEKEVKKTPRKRTKKKEVKAFSLAEMYNWTDEECKAKDKELKFKVADVRDIFKSVVSLKQQLNETTEKLNLMKNIISKGLMTGYNIVCPKCGEKHQVSSADLKRNEEIVCEKCGEKYVESRNIKGITFLSDEIKEISI